MSLSEKVDKILEKYNPENNSQTYIIPSSIIGELKIALNVKNNDKNLDIYSVIEKMNQLIKANEDHKNNSIRTPKDKNDLPIKHGMKYTGNDGTVFEVIGFIGTDHPVVGKRFDGEIREMKGKWLTPSKNEEILEYESKIREYKNSKNNNNNYKDEQSIEDLFYNSGSLEKLFKNKKENKITFEKCTVDLSNNTIKGEGVSLTIPS